MPVVAMVTDAASEPEVGSAGAVRGRGRAVAAPGAAAPRARRDPRAAAPSRLAALVQRDLPVRALLVPLLRRAGRRHAARLRGRSGRATAGSTRPRSATPCTGCSSASISPARRLRADLEELVRAWYPTIADAELERVRGDRRRLLRLARSRAGSRRSTAFAVERPFAFELDGVLLNGRLDVLWRDGARRRSSSTTRRTPSAAATPPRSSSTSTAASAASTRSRACAPGASEVEVVYQFLEAPEASSRRRSPAPTSTRWRRSSATAIARIREGDFRPTPSDVRLLGLPGARSRLRRAAPRLGARRSAAPRADRRGIASAACGSPRSTTSTGTCRRSRPCSPTVAAARPTRSSAAAISSSGPMPAECLDLLEAHGSASAF